MRCPFCETDSMCTVNSGEAHIDQCDSCKAAWFDRGEIRELTEGRFPEPGEPAQEGDLPAGGKEKILVRMSDAWKKAASLFCPKCSTSLIAVNFQNTGTPVFCCRKCGGILVSRDGVVELAGTFGLHRKNAALYGAMGESIAETVQERFDRAGPKEVEAADVAATLIPVVVPLKNEESPSGSYPVVTYGLLVLMAAAYLFYVSGIAETKMYVARIALSSGTGFGHVSAPVLLQALFFHGGIFPLAMNGLFLFALGGKAEDRMGRVPFLLFYLACGVAAGAVHLLWGPAGAPTALGAAGAVAGLLGAYIVFFPQARISIYKAGEIATVPAYILVCSWVVAEFLWEWGPLSCVFNPAPYSITGSIGGLATGAAIAASWRLIESQKA